MGTSVASTPAATVCSAPARVLVLLTSGNDLVFCEHHARQYKAALKSIAVLVEYLPGVG